MKIKSIILLFGLSLWPALGIDILTIGGGGGLPYPVTNDQVVEVIAASGGGVQNISSFTYRSANATNTFYVMAKEGSGGIISVMPIVLAGPGEIVTSTTLTILVRTKTEYLAKFNPPPAATSTSVVIPEDAAGPVTIVLESSTDLVTWTAANPGTYGSSTTRRFFRVRAVQNPTP